MSEKLLGGGNKKCQNKDQALRNGLGVCRGVWCVAEEALPPPWAGEKPEMPHGLQCLGGVSQMKNSETPLNSCRQTVWVNFLSVETRPAVHGNAC